MLLKSVFAVYRMEFSPRRLPAALAIIASLLLSLSVLAMPQQALAQDDGDEKADKNDEKAKDKDAGEGGEAAGPSYVGIGLGVYLENSRREDSTTALANTTDNSFDYSADNFLQGNIWLLKTVTNNVRAGAGIHYYGGYETVEEPEEDEDAEDIEASELGQKITLFARGEWLVSFSDDMDLVLGAQAGLIGLFPDGEFKREIEAIRDDGATVFGGPRPGLSLAPIVGARWQLDERLALRADFAVHWERLILLNINTEVEGTNFERSSTAKILRYNLGLGMEVTL